MVTRDTGGGDWEREEDRLERESVAVEERKEDAGEVSRGFDESCCSAGSSSCGADLFDLDLGPEDEDSGATGFGAVPDWVGGGVDDTGGTMPRVLGSS